MSNHNTNKIRFGKESGYQPNYNNPREIRDGYQPTTQQTGNGQQGSSGNANRPAPPSGGSGVPNNNR